MAETSLSPAPAPRPARTALPHDQDITALVLDRQEDLRDHNEYPALGGWRNVPHTLRVGWVVAGVVGGLDVARVVTELTTAVLVCWHRDRGSGQAGLDRQGQLSPWPCLRLALPCPPALAQALPGSRVPGMKLFPPSPGFPSAAADTFAEPPGCGLGTLPARDKRSQAVSAARGQINALLSLLRAWRGQRWRFYELNGSQP